MTTTVETVALKNLRIKVQSYRFLSGAYFRRVEYLTTQTEYMTCVALSSDYVSKNI
jgi:hypothetical protein